MNPVPAYVLAGGRSSRFGSDKARAIVHGQPLLRHVATLLQPVAASITVVADRVGKYDDLGLRTIADRQPGLGPLAGLDAALSDLPAGSGWLLLCCCDAVILRAEWLNQLCAAPRGPELAIAMRSRHWQPMPALYARDAHPLVSALLSDSNRSMQRLLDELPTRALPLPPDWPANWQINTPEDHERLT